MRVAASRLTTQSLVSQLRAKIAAASENDDTSLKLKTATKYVILRQLAIDAARSWSGEWSSMSSRFAKP